MKLKYLEIFLLSSKIPVLCIMAHWKTIIRRVKIDGQKVSAVGYTYNNSVAKTWQNKQE